MHFNNLPELQAFRRKLRSNLTPAEATLWKMLKGSKLQGRKFRRQHSFSGYIFDFYCSSEKIAVELDGEVHFNERAAQHDYQRRLFVKYFGILIVRFENRYVFEEPDMIIDRIQSSFGWNKGLPKEDWIDG